MVHHGNLVAEDLNRDEILDSEPRTVHVGYEIDPQIGAGGDHDKVQFTPNSEHVNSELVSVSKKLTTGRRMQRAERYGVFSTKQFATIKFVFHIGNYNRMYGTIHVSCCHRAEVLPRNIAEDDQDAQVSVPRFVDLKHLHRKQQRYAPNRCVADDHHVQKMSCSVREGNVLSCEEAEPRLSKGSETRSTVRGILLVKGSLIFLMSLLSVGGSIDCRSQVALWQIFCIPMRTECRAICQGRVRISDCVHHQITGERFDSFVVWLCAPDVTLLQV